VEFSIYFIFNCVTAPAVADVKIQDT